MPLTIIFDDGLFCPFVICDWCGERIETKNGGYVDWFFEDEPGPKLYFNHRRSCSMQFKHHFSKKGMHIYGRSLDKFLAQLLYNLNEANAYAE